MATQINWLSPLFNGQQFFDQLGKPLAGGLIFVLTAGSATTLQESYATITTDTKAPVHNPNPIVLDAHGRNNTMIFLTAGKQYALMVMTANNETCLMYVSDVNGLPIQLPTQYYTSAIYPFQFSDKMTAIPGPLLKGFDIQYQVDPLKLSQVPTLQSGSLVVTINYLTYSYTEAMKLTQVPALQPGSLVTTINLLTYSSTEAMKLSQVPTLQSGSLAVTINYINYVNWPTEQMKLTQVPALQPGSLV